MEALTELSDADLETLQRALTSGRLTSPFTELGLRRFCPDQWAGRLASWFASCGMTASQLAQVLDAVILTRRKDKQSRLVELVWTGPETLGIANRDTSVVVRDLFMSARHEVIVAGFAVYQGRDIFESLAKRMDTLPSLQASFFLDVKRPPSDASSTEQILTRFLEHFRSREWPGERLPKMYYDPRSLAEDGSKKSSLHAKCVVVDRRVALVTSANFTEAAQMRNIEVGALIHSGHFGESLVSHFSALVDAGFLLPFRVDGFC